MSSLLFSLLDMAFGSVEYLNQIRFNIDYNPFGNVFSFIITVLGIAIAGVCIYFFNKKKSFANTELTEREKRKLAIVLSVVTAPYTLLIPMELFDSLMQFIM